METETSSGGFSVFSLDTQIALIFLSWEHIKEALDRGRIPKSVSVKKRLP